VRKTNEQSLKDLIAIMLKQQKLKGKLNEVRLIDCWEKVMGPTIAQRTLEITLKDHTLYLKVASAPLKQELHFNTERVIELLNEALGENVVKNVILR
jgi:predicted nucleic acid-binding Zn ribbon protein